MADVHLGASLRGFRDHAAERQKMVRTAFQELPRIATDTGAIALLVAGDLFDGTDPSKADRVLVSEVFRKLDEQGCSVFVVPGNHDPITRKSHPYLAPLGPAHVFLEPEFQMQKARELEWGTLRIHGFAFDPVKCASPLETLKKSAEPGIDIALMHASLKMADHWQGSPNTFSPNEAELAELGVDYVALGDYHRPRMPDEFQSGLTACYPGSFSAVNRKETGVRGLVLVEFAEGKAAKTKLIESQVARLVELEPIDLTGLEDQSNLEEMIASKMPKAALPRVTLRGTPEFRFDPEALQITLDQRYDFCVIKDESSYINSNRIKELGADDTVVGHLVRVAARRTEAVTDEEEKRAVERALRHALSALGVV